MVCNRTKCLLRHCDPYQKDEIPQSASSKPGEPSANTVKQSPPGPAFIYLPSTFPFIAPFAMLPDRIAYGLWMSLTGGILILAACLMWNYAAAYSPVISGGLIVILLANSAIVLANGNLAGIVVGLCVIAVWCLLKERFVLAGILCFASSLAIKPHDAGLILLYFLLVGAVHRKRAMQTLAVTGLLILSSAVWVWQIAPNWIPEMQTHLIEDSAHGSFNDPGPDGATSISRTMIAITDLQAVVSTFRDDPTFYNPVSYLVGGTLLVVWSITTLRLRNSQPAVWFALAAVTCITLLVTYHRVYDAKILMLTIPACSILWAEGGAIGNTALMVTAGGFVFTGEIPIAILLSVTGHLHNPPSGLLGKMETVRSLCW